MPYIKSYERVGLEPLCSPKTPGELNYVITVLIRAYWKRTGNYQGINDIVGALEGAKLEFYRKVASKYEDKKCEDNGEVY